MAGALIASLPDAAGLHPAGQLLRRRPDGRARSRADRRRYRGSPACSPSPPVASSPGSGSAGSTSRRCRHPTQTRAHLGDYPDDPRLLAGSLGASPARPSSPAHGSAHWRTASRRTYGGWLGAVVRRGPRRTAPSGVRPRLRRAGRVQRGGRRRGRGGAAAQGSAGFVRSGSSTPLGGSSTNCPADFAVTEDYCGANAACTRSRRCSLSATSRGEPSWYRTALASPSTSSTSRPGVRLPAARALHRTGRRCPHYNKRLTGRPVPSLRHHTGSPARVVPPAAPARGRPRDPPDVAVPGCDRPVRGRRRRSAGPSTAHPGFVYTIDLERGPVDHATGCTGCTRRRSRRRGR